MKVIANEEEGEEAEIVSRKLLRWSECHSLYPCSMELPIKSAKPKPRSYKLCGTNCSFLKEKIIVIGKDFKL